jgi:hypothetical protein
MGVPFLANSQAGVLYPLNWLFLWADPPKQVAYSIGLHIWLAGMGTYLFARRRLGLSSPAALVGGAVFAFSGFLGAQVEHLNQLQVSAWLPWLFLCFDQSQRQEPALSIWHNPTVWANRRQIGLLALVIALMLLAGHTQSVYISLFGLGLYGLFRAGLPWDSIKKIKALFLTMLQRLLTLIPLGLAAVLAVLLAAAQLWPTLELTGL